MNAKKVLAGLFITAAATFGLSSCATVATPVGAGLIVTKSKSGEVATSNDLGTKVGTEFEVENLLNIINNRIDNGKSNIYTSNIVPEDLKHCIGERLYSRTVNLSSVIELKGQDKRGLV
jgi:DNA replication protein DnaC